MLICKILKTTLQMGLEKILNIEPLDINILKIGLTAYKRLQLQLEDHRGAAESNASHLQYWSQYWVSL